MGAILQALIVVIQTVYFSVIGYRYFCILEIKGSLKYLPLVIFLMSIELGHTLAPPLYYQEIS